MFNKICFFLRIYEGFSFLVSMLHGVFLDLKYFMAFYTMVLLVFTFLFSVLSLQLGEAYGGIGGVGYFIMSFRASTGDFELDNYNQLGPLVYLAWLVWVVAVIILQMIFMNFIIAVISGSYEDIMQEKDSVTYRGKADLIAERELHMTEADLNNPDYFPRYIVLRRPADSQGEKGEELKEGIQELKDTINLSYMKTVNKFK